MLLYIKQKNYEAKRNLTFSSLIEADQHSYSERNQRKIKKQENAKK